MGSHLQSLYSSVQASLRIKSLTTYLPVSIIKRSYSEHGKKENNNIEEYGIDHHQERAPSTAEEFKRVEEEFKRVEEAKSEQGFVSQTVEKTQDGVEEAIIGDESTLESVKEAHKEPPGRSKFHKTGDD